MARVICTLGLMSGTSLDGLDVADCVFQLDKGKWSYELKRGVTFPFPTDLVERLKSSKSMLALELVKLERDFTNFCIDVLQQNFQEEIKSVDLIAVHGYTVFHNPKASITHQLFNGGMAAARLSKNIICDFRRGDVAVGGQGAPLVPMGDYLLFNNFKACVNLGGFGNCFLLEEFKAFDIAPVNLVLNELAARVGQAYDEGGQLAHSGSINRELLELLNKIEYYAWPPPKSLGTEDLELLWKPLLDSFDSVAPKNLLRTYCMHLVHQFGRILPESGRVLFTGGGAHNAFLMEQFATKLSCEVVVPSKLLIDFKEALVFAFLGTLNYEQEANTLNAVTGAKYPLIAGALYRGVK